MEINYAPFTRAVPVWAEGRECEMNLTCHFEGSFTAEAPFVLKVTASTLYTAWIDGVLVGCGPARCAHDFFRVDEWPIAPQADNNEHRLTIEVAGYNVNCYSCLDQPSFLQAELSCGDKVLLFTGEGGGFAGSTNNMRVQRSQRFSFQRAFTEVYKQTDSPEKDYTPCTMAPKSDRKLLPRGIPLPNMNCREAQRLFATGKVKYAAVPQPPFHDRATTRVGLKIKGFKVDELDGYITDELGRYSSSFDSFTPQPTADRSTLPAGHFHIYDFGQGVTGMLSLMVEAENDTTLYMTFDEKLSSGDVNHLRMGCVNAVSYRLRAGHHTLLTMEPYTVRYLKIFSPEAKITIGRPCIMEYKANLPIAPPPIFDDARLELVYQAAVETMLQNSSDIFMDCPSRERAGWLCDSFFTARGEKTITGENQIERNFLENFLLPDSFDFLPDGMLPMCYPADHYDGNFIPNWAMWLVLELEDYLERGGLRTLVDAFRPKINALLAYFTPFLNEDGLLEDLAGWVFVDWSRANDPDVVCGVNYPSNMLYARMLEAVSRLYDSPSLAAQAENIHSTIRRQSYNGICFVDNAVRKAGRLIPGTTCTEACQNYAFFCGTATPKRYPKLWDDFTYKFKRSAPLHNKYDLAPANAFIALYVRLAALANAGQVEQIRAEVLEVFYPQAMQTGTLWELLTDNSSLNHGFASYVATLLTLVSEQKEKDKPVN